MQPKIIRESIISLYSPNSRAGDLGEYIKYLQDNKTEAENKGYSNILIEDVSEYAEDGPDYHLFGDRFENMKEYNKRIKKENAIKERKRKKKEIVDTAEMKEYERLKKKFEKGE